mgnify:FL=1
MAQDKLLLVDGNSIAFRAFYALFRELDKFKNAQGLHTNAVYAFKNMLDVLLKKEKFTHVLVAFDAGKVTFRTKIFSDYKGGRQKTPSELSEQLPFIRELLTCLGITSYELVDYEADDIIGTLSRQGEEAGMPVTIVTGDRDLTQLTSEKVTVLVTRRGVNDLEAYTPEHMKEVNGVTPTEFIDMKALMGDTSDNYPGVTKVGPKTASRLIQKYHSVENLYQHLDDFKPSKLKENLVNDKDKAFRAKTLATIDRQSPLTVTLVQTKRRPVDLEKLRAFYEQLDFNRFLSELPQPDAAASEEKPQAEIDYQILDAERLSSLKKVSNDHEISFYLGMLGENYHLADFSGFALEINQHFYVSRNMTLLQDPILKTILENPKIHKNVFGLKPTLVGLLR